MITASSTVIDTKSAQLVTFSLKKMRLVIYVRIVIYVKMTFKV